LTVLASSPKDDFKLTKFPDRPVWQTASSVNIKTKEKIKTIL
jgi:hypothetical protein